MAKTRKRNRPDATGRSSTSRFARLDHRLLSSNAYRALTPNGRSLLVELTMLYNGENNGSLYLSVRDGAHRLGLADLSAASRAFDELVDLGFIELTHDAHFKVKAAEHSRARCWRLTWLAGPGRRGPEWRFMDREPAPGTLAHRRMERGLRALKSYRRARDGGHLPVLDSYTLGSCQPQSAAEGVLESDTLNRKNGGKPPIRIVPDSATHIATTMGSGSAEPLIGWWKRDWTNHIAAATQARLVALQLAERILMQREAA